MLLDDVADLLSTGGVGGVGTTSDWSIFKGKLPDAPEKAVAVYETGGLPSVHAMSTGPGNAAATLPRIQVLVRSPAYSTGRQKAHDAFRLLDGLRERTINGVRYLWIAAVQTEPFPIGRDENDRPLIACNYDVVKEMST